MIAFPLAFYALLTALTGALPQLPITHDMVLMITVIAGLPTMTTIAMFTGRKNNMPEYAVGFVLVSTLFSLALPDDCVGSCVLELSPSTKRMPGPPALGISSTPPTTPIRGGRAVFQGDIRLRAHARSAASPADLHQSADGRRRQRQVPSVRGCHLPEPVLRLVCARWVSAHRSQEGLHQRDEPNG